MDIDPRDGTIRVVDRQARVQRFRPDGSYVMEWAMPEKSLGKPTGLGVGPDGRVWVADTHYHRVICWSPEGKELLRIGSYGTEPGQFIYPCDVEVGPDGNVWVAEFGGNDRIQVFTPEGAFVRAIGGNGRAPGQFDRPQSIAFSKDGRELWVADACNHRLQVLDLEGHPLRSIGTAGSGEGELAYPYGIDLLPDGTALVTEFGNHRLQRFDMATGRSLGCVRAVTGAPTPLVLHVVDGDRVRSVPSGGERLAFPVGRGFARHGGLHPGFRALAGAGGAACDASCHARRTDAIAASGGVA
jgi:DNA-binding beta-propeller fold protein YncE